MAASVMSLLEPSMAGVMAFFADDKDFPMAAFHDNFPFDGPMAAHEPLYQSHDELHAQIDELALDFECATWSLRPPDQWTPADVADWLRAWAHHNAVPELELAHLLYNPLSGFELCQLRADYFAAVSPQYGHLIHDALQSLIGQARAQLAPAPPDPFQLPLADLLHAQLPDAQDGQSLRSADCDSERESLSSHLSQLNERKEAPPAVPKAVAGQKKAGGRRGRPPKKDAKSRNKGNGKLWEFIRDLLLNPATNPALIRWERREDGVFKFVQSDKVAKMWGERKQNPRMTYEKLSRAMRYYYKSQVLLPVFGRRLVYKFGPNATGWRPTL